MGIDKISSDDGHTGDPVVLESDHNIHSEIHSVFVVCVVDGEIQRFCFRIVAAAEIITHRENGQIVFLPVAEADPKPAAASSARFLLQGQ